MKKTKLTSALIATLALCPVIASATSACTDTDLEIVNKSSDVLTVDEVNPKKGDITGINTGTTISKNESVKGRMNQTESGISDGTIRFKTPKLEFIEIRYNFHTEAASLYTKCIKEIKSAKGSAIDSGEYYQSASTNEDSGNKRTVYINKD